MAILQKKPQTSTSAPLYTVGLNKTLLIAGLGNVGKEFELTRHNLGFECLNNFASYHEFPGWINKKDLKCELTQKTIGNVRVILIKPSTMMNLSGTSVRLVSAFYRIEPSCLVVTHDEADILFGQIRTRQGGQAAGHNGIESIIQQIGDNFSRIRIGIKPEEKYKGDMSSFVLAKLSKQEINQLPNLLRETNSILTEYIYRGSLLPETRSFIV